MGGGLHQKNNSNKTMVGGYDIGVTIIANWGKTEENGERRGATG